MDRSEFITLKRKLSIRRYNNIFANNYDENWGKIDKTHKKTLNKFLNLCTKNGFILDAACGTGKYFKIILKRKFSLIGIDQSEKMIEKAKEKFPNVKLINLRLQELEFKSYFNGVICIDAMENVFPEHWNIVFKNFYNALNPGGYLYFTVETIENEVIEKSYEEGIKKGLPIVKGEVAHEEGYHYYPKISEVKKWLKENEFKLLIGNQGDGYYHFITKKL